MVEHPSDRWEVGEAYEPYVGRWSRGVAREFIRWLGVSTGSRWLDVGCGTGALTETILALADPESVKGIDPSDGFISFAGKNLKDKRATFARGDAVAIAEDSTSYDAVVAGLVLNFVPSPGIALAEFSRVARPEGTVGVYVWDYAGEMQMLRYFWDAVASLDPESSDLDEAERFPICHPDGLLSLFQGAGLEGVGVRAIDVPTVFADFDDYWSPFLGGQGAAPTYVASLSEERRSELRERIEPTLPRDDDGSIHLIARAWAAKGRRPGSRDG
ncbi:MAG: class I SAM-dependent methyltransferase [Dehalococcoidia bacterium]